ncbi:MAG: hypothetical protein JO021_05035, partial [Alphaproteobacteria bacterium]|nr:hypothetical protein [Alphaproteobacteria bacterium]
MTRRLAALVALLLCAAPAAAQPLKIVYDRTVTFDVAGATAAYALDATIADASAAAGVVRVHGTGVGRTTVVVVVGDTTSAIDIEVVAPPVVYPAGVLESLASHGDSGYAELRATSNPRQLAGVLDLRRQEGARFEHVHLLAASYFDTEFGSRFGLPSLLYEIGRGRRTIAFGDEPVLSSPLTIFGTQLRGFHYEDDRWILHAGAAFLAAYQGTLFAAKPEYAAGLTRRFHLSERSEIDASAYEFRNPAGAQLGARSGPLLSVAYRNELRNHYSLLSEVAAGEHAAGAAVVGEYDDPLRHFGVDIRYRPFALPSLALEAEHGTFATISEAAKITRRIDSAGTLSLANYDLPQLEERTLSAGERLIYAVTKHVSVNGGVLYSRFVSGGDTPLDVRSLAIPVGLEYAAAHFNAGGEVQPTFDLAGRRADAYGIHAGTTAGPLHVSAYYRRDVDLPTLATFFSEVPGLQDALQRAGIYVSDVAQIIQYLRDSAFLVSLGFANGLQFNVAPVRIDSGLTIDAGGVRDRVGFSFFDSRTQIVTGETHLQSATITATHAISERDEINAAASILRSTTGATSTTTPIFGVALHHRFTAIPSLAFHRHGSIRGHVFRDEDRSGRFSPPATGMPGVTVTLDDRTSTRTDANGFYTFDDVAPGPHRVAVEVPPGRPFALTGDSPRTVDVNTTADFGVTFLLGKVYGRALNDAGAGIAGVTVRLLGRSGTETTTTSDDGSYEFSNV